MATKTVVKTAARTVKAAPAKKTARKAAPAKAPKVTAEMKAALTPKSFGKPSDKPTPLTEMNVFFPPNGAAKPASGKSPATLGIEAAKADDFDRALTAGIEAEIAALRAKSRATQSQAARNKLAKARKVLEAKLAAAPKPAKAAKPNKQVALTAGAMTGSKRTIADMMQRPNGATEAEVCKKLGWQAAGATISRVIKLLPAGSVTKTKGDDGKTRYIAK